MDLASRESGCPDQLVNIARTWAQRRRSPHARSRGCRGVASPCALHPRRRARQRELEAAYLRLPGTANTSRPCSPAKRAVISEPERSAASTTTTPSEIPEITRLQRGKSFPRGEKP